MDQKPPVLRIGLIADIQHADIDDGTSAYGAIRHYRDATTKVRLAAADWKAEGCAFAVNLGDSVDRRGGAGAPAALARVLAAFGGFAPVLHVAGNHDLSALPEEDAASLSPVRSLDGMDAVAGEGCYCDIRVGSSWRVLIVDTYEVAVCRNGAAAREMRARLIAEAKARRKPHAYLAMHEELNGAVGKEQLAWIQGRLKAAEEAGDRVVVLSHAALHQDVTYYGDAVCWDWRQVSCLLDSFPHVVAAVITGHDHHLGELVSEGGIYHRVLEAAMEGEVGVPTHAILELRGDLVRIVGRGNVKSWEKTFAAPK